MHIAEGVLSLPVLATGAGLAIGGLYMGLRALDQGRIIMAGALAALFFVASLIHVPLGFTNAHLMMVGFMGVLLGWVAFPAIFVGLLLQALLFQYGGLTTLGVNTFTMGFASVLSWFLFRALARILPEGWGIRVAAFCGGAFGVLFAALLTALALAFTNEGFRGAALVLFSAHVPVMLVEGLVTMFAVDYIRRIKPAFFVFSLQQN